MATAIPTSIYHCQVLLYLLVAAAAHQGLDTSAPSCEGTQGNAYIQKSQVVERKSPAELALVEDQYDGQLNSSALCCEDFSGWPNVDNGVTCGNCRALVLTAPYDGRCDKYCESFGHVCVSAAEERSEGCGVRYWRSCRARIRGTSDMLCSCRRPDDHPSCSPPTPAPIPTSTPPTPAPAPAPTPSPARAPTPMPTLFPTQPPATAQCCRPFGEWPNVDKVTCGDCTALVLTRDYGGRCDAYCESFGHVCVAAAEEKDESCDAAYTRPCNEAIEGTSDMLCTCRLPAGPETTCPTPAPRPTLAPGQPGVRRIEVRGRQLLVNGVPLHLKGVAWNPVQRGSSRVDFRRYVEQDAELMASAGINAVRTYDHIGDRRVLDTLWSRGIWVINSVYNSGRSSTSKVAREVNSVKDHPAILMWTIGNEWNYNGLYVEMSSGASMSRIGEVARLVKDNDPDHPVASIYGEVPSQYVLDTLTEVDIWGINVYRGLGFGNVFEKFAARSGKPLFLGEYGADAYDARRKRENQEAQARATRELTEELVRRSAVNPGGLCLGGFIFEWADEWWKDSSGSRSRHDVGGVAPGGGPYPDFTFNEEWWGLVDIDRRPRAALEAYAQVPFPQ